MEAREAMKTARMLKRFSQSEAAEHIGVSQNTISRWELGATVPNMTDLIKMGEVYGISLDKLCGVQPF